MPQWTLDQKKAIETTGRNLLVSAAAGSGKTAVLVERIIERIMDEEHPLDLDRCVVVTFTKAAAGEMKQRIREAIEKKVLENPENMRLQMQLALVDDAPITTIDSFCLKIVRNYFSEIDLNPGFRTADTAEIELLKADVMERLMEEEYTKAEPAFMNFVSAYATGRDDGLVTKAIMKLYDFSLSNPWPKEWLSECGRIYECETEDDFKATLVYKDYINLLKGKIECFASELQDCLNIANEPDGPSAYVEPFEYELSAVKNMLLQKTDEDFIEAVCEFVPTPRMPSVKKIDQVNPKKKEIASKSRNKVKESIRNIKKDLAAGVSGHLDILKATAPFAKELIHLADEFYDACQAAKRDRNIIEFSDMEHFALDILIRRENGETHYTQAADSLANYYQEILTDEYQDSNKLQDVILNAISRGRFDPAQNNIYMVGDLKQSIYRFRKACPELFMDKYDRYTMDDSPEQKVLLKQNFRSRASVLFSANAVFNHAMNKFYGGVGYGEAERLVPGLTFPDFATAKVENEDGELVDVVDLAQTVPAGEAGTSGLPARAFEGANGRTEVITVLTGAAKKAEIYRLKGEEPPEKLKGDPNEGSAIELEAVTIASRILEMMHGEKPYYVYNPKKDCYRRLRLSDIVVLTRASKGWAETMTEVLMNFGIDAYSESSNGYFEAREIRTVLDFLRVIDNPLQDIPMAGVMLGYFGGFTTEELAGFKARHPKQLLYLSLQEEALESEKVSKFLEKIKRYQRDVKLLSIHDLLWELIYDCSFYDYAGQMPSGTRRQANLELLITKAEEFGATSYSGLFQFLRYIDQMKEYEVEFGEVSVLSENQDLVRIMTIHKSKGLEFPVVFVAGMGKQMNMQDVNASIVLDENLGIGMKNVDLEKRIMQKTFIKTAIGQRIKMDSISEEQRLLYVAMTRAREKLILVGTVSGQGADEAWENTAKKLSGVASGEPGSSSDYAPGVGSRPQNFAELDSAKNYFDFAMPEVKMPEYADLFETFKALSLDEKEAAEIDAATQKNSGTESEAADDVMLLPKAPEIQTASQEEVLTEVSEHVEGAASYVDMKYPYPVIRGKHPKITVTELKRQRIEEEEALNHDSVYQADFTKVLEEVEGDLSDAVNAEAADLEEEDFVPDFISGEEKVLAGNERGTAYHRVMELLDFTDAADEAAIQAQIEKMAAEEKLTLVQADCVYSKDILQFVTSEIGQRVAKAQVDGTLHREQQFMFGVPFAEDPGQMQLIQGVIDLYFEENGRYVILDYKTDRVRHSAEGEDLLKKRYSVQLDYYAEALEQVTGKSVAGTCIYSFALGKEIKLKET